MSRYVLGGVLVLSVVSGGLAAQSAPQEVGSWHVNWADVVDRVGTHRTLPVFEWAGVMPPQADVRYTQSPAVITVVSLESARRETLLTSDADGLARILSDGFVGVSADGAVTNKAQTVERTRASGIRALAPEQTTVTARGATVLVTGEESATGAGGPERLLFSRVYVQEPSAEWRLMTSTEFRKP